MTDFLADLVMRSYGRVAGDGSTGSIQPRLASVFELAPAGPAGDGEAEIEDVNVDSGARRPHRGLLSADAGIDVRSSGDAPKPTAGPSGPTIAGEEPRPVAPPPAETTQNQRESSIAASTTPAPATLVVRDATVSAPTTSPRESTAPPPEAGVLSPAPVPDPARDRAPSSDRIAPQSSVPPPVVHVTIGRVEVRAVLPTPSPRLPPAPPPTGPKTLSLTEYLDGGKGKAGGRP